MTFLIYFLLLVPPAPTSTPTTGAPSSGVVTDASHSSADCGTDPVVLGDDVVYAWSSELVGSACRTTDVNRDNRAGTVRVDIDVTSGGYDAGVAANTMPVRVDQTADAPPLSATTTVDLRGEGHWWAGPKFCICETPKWIGLEGNWECYIIEDADMPPADLMNMLGGTYRGRQIVNGDVYLHYTKPWMQWQQAIAIRQTYRQSGDMHFAEIVRYWRDNLDVPNWYMHSPKVGLETTGQIKGHWQWTDIQTSDLTKLD